MTGIRPGDGPLLRARSPALDEAHRALSDASIVAVYDFEVQESHRLPPSWSTSKASRSLKASSRRPSHIDVVAVVFACRCPYALEVAHANQVLHLDITRQRADQPSRPGESQRRPAMADASGYGAAGGTIGYMPSAMRQENLDYRGAGVADRTRCWRARNRFGARSRAR